MIDVRIGDREFLLVEPHDAKNLNGVFALLRHLLKRDKSFAGKEMGAGVKVLEGKIREFLRRADGCAVGCEAATAQPLFADGVDDEEVVDAATAAQLLRMSSAAVRKRCGHGRWLGIAETRGGKWWIPLREIMIELAENE